MDIKFNIERTVVTAKARMLDATWAFEDPQVIKWISVNMSIINPVYKWVPHKNSSLMLDRDRSYLADNLDEYLDSVQAWCQETGNGRRTSYDTFHFGKPAKMTAFILRWNNG